MSCDENILQNPCEDELTNMTSVEACKEKEKRKTEIMDVFMKVVSTPGEMFDKLIDGVTGTATTKSKVVNRIRNKLSNQQIIDLKQTCKNQSIISQTNLIDGTECIKQVTEQIKILAELRKSGVLSENQFLKEAKEIRESSGDVSGITQELSNKISNYCKFKSVADLFAKMKSSIDNQAFLEALAQSQGLLSSAESDQDVCNDISTEISACNWTKGSQCCVNNSVVSQENIFRNNCFPSKRRIIQRAHNEILNQCVGVTQSSAKVEAESDVKNKVVVDSSTKSSGLTAGFLILMLIIIGLVVFAPVLGTVAFTSNVLKSLGWFLGALILLGLGIFFMVKFGNSKVEGFDRKEFHISNCKGVKFSTSEPVNVESEEKAKENVMANNKFLGYDLFVSEEGKTSVLYVTDLGEGNIENGVLNCNFREEGFITLPGKTFLKETSEKVFLILGVTCFVGCGILTLIGIIMALKKSPKVPVKGKKK